MNRNAEFDPTVTQAAARWLGEMLDGRGRRAEFFAWLEESPRHVEEFLFVLADAQDVALMTPEQRLRVEELSRELGYDEPEDSKVVPVSPAALDSMPSSPAVQAAAQPRAASGHRGGLRSAFLALAAAAVLAVVGVWFWTGPGAWKTYSTQVGEQRALNLADGSIVHLNTDSAVEVRLADTSRSVRLVRGEAMFTVEHDASRPFLVYTSNAVIQAIGTRFVVHQQAGKTRVAVIEGLVQVSEDSAQSNAKKDEASAIQPVPPPSASISQVRFLGAGEAAEVANAHGVSEPEAVDPLRATAWRQRRLVFEEDSLANIANEFNRYNATIKMKAEGTAGLELFSGTFDADAPEALMQALAADPTLLVTRNGNEIMIRKRESEEP